MTDDPLRNLVLVALLLGGVVYWVSVLIWLARSAHETWRGLFGRRRHQPQPELDLRLLSKKKIG